MQKPKNKPKKAACNDEDPFRVELTIGTNSSFDTILLEAIDEAFASLGVAVREPLYRHLENSMGIKKHEIPQKIEDFQITIEKIFGIGSRHLEILIMKKLYQKINEANEIKLPQAFAPNLTFQQYLQLIKNHLEE